MFSKPLRVTAFVVVSFFAWTFGGFATLAYASKVGGPTASMPVPPREKSPEERFNAVLEEIEAALAEPGADLKVLSEGLRAKRGEIEALDADIRRQFAETEQRLKEAKLPAEILERHTDFVRHYDENLRELNANLASIEKAKDKTAADPAVARARAHLAKVKAPSRHQPLDPENLPCRQPKVKKREPRTRPGEFARYLDQDTLRTEKRIMVASNGSLAGLLSPTPVKTIAPPTSADLAETIDAQLTPRDQGQGPGVGLQAGQDL